MLPSKAIVKGCLRWLHLLRASSLPQAWLILRTDPLYTDLTQSQYGAALELLRNIGLADGSTRTLILADGCRVVSMQQASQLLFERIIEHAAPAWLPDSDILIPDPSEIPEDAAELGSALGLQDLQCYAAIRNVHSRVDLAKRKLVGDAGELALIRFLEERSPGSTVHVASLGDGYGYDIAFLHKGREWHLEVKSTTRRGRLTVHLSRNEYETSLADSEWRLVVVGLDENLQLKALATLAPGQLAILAPADTSIRARWQSAAFEVAKDSLSKGLRFAAELPDHSAPYSGLWSGPDSEGRWFGWLPES